MANPYQSPTGESGEIGTRPNSPDYGILAGWYFRLLATLSIITVLAVYFMRGVFVPDWTPILTIWTGNLLIRRSRSARSWVIAICSMFAAISALIILAAIFVGTQNISFSYGTFEIESPSKSLAIALSCITLTLFAIPILLLANRKASLQFSAKNAG